MRVLYITANPKLEVDSVCLGLGRRFIDEYSQLNPDVEITHLDLAQKSFPHLEGEAFEQYTDQNGICIKLAKDFKSFDKYVIAAPMWNLSIPSVLKAYIDHIIVPGEMFRYGEQGRPVGLCGGALLYLGARGGNYSEGPNAKYAMDSLYFEGLCQLIGINSFQSLVIDSVGSYRRESAAEIVQKKLNEIQTLATHF